MAYSVQQLVLLHENRYSHIDYKDVAIHSVHVPGELHRQNIPVNQERRQVELVSGAKPAHAEPALSLSKGPRRRVPDTSAPWTALGALRQKRRQVKLVEGRADQDTPFFTPVIS